MTAGTIALTRQTFVGKVMSLLLNMLSMLVITSSKEQVFFNFMATVTIYSDFEAQKRKVCSCKINQYVTIRYLLGFLLQTYALDQRIVKNNLLPS